VTVLKEAVQAVADAAYVAHGEDAIGAVLALGTPGQRIEVAGSLQETGGGWGNGKTFEVLADGVELWLDDQGSPAAITAKLNELIASFNQLLADYQASVVPSTATAITPITP
jgi:hypothetical protein